MEKAQRLASLHVVVIPKTMWSLEATVDSAFAIMRDGHQIILAWQLPPSTFQLGRVVTGAREVPGVRVTCSSGYEFANRSDVVSVDDGLLVGCENFSAHAARLWAMWICGYVDGRCSTTQPNHASHTAHLLLRVVPPRNISAETSRTVE